MRSVHGVSRRSFLKSTALAVNTAASLALLTPAAEVIARLGPGPIPGKQPWHRRTFRWGQTNLSEEDPASCDVEWWRGYWKRTRIQGVIINAGGIVAYYPSQNRLHYRAKSLGNRDLYGELAKAAQTDGLAVLARMDSNRAHEDLFRARPDWFARDIDNNPYRSGELYIACINSAYYEEWIPGILREIIQRSRPEGITDNSWSGLGRGNICYCANCERNFRERTGKSIPREKNWDDPVYRSWIDWNYARRLAIWDLNNSVTRAAGGPDCLWLGMNSGSVSGQSQSFRPYKEICERAAMIMLDHQARGDSGGFQQNGECGKLIHGLLGWDKLIPESMAMYQAGRPTFRKASKPEPEARLWVLEGFAGTIQPWWHHVGAKQEDRRQFQTIGPLNRWHQANEPYLINRQPVATVGVVWSQRDTDFHGRDHPEELVDLPFRGMTQALVRARIPYLPVHADHIDRDARGLRLLILPNLAAVSEDQVTSIRRFVHSGGGLLATGEASLLNEWGDPRPDFALADLFGVHLPAGRQPLSESARVRRAADTVHSYLRLPGEVAKRHPLLSGFEATDILPFGGTLEELTLANNTLPVATFIPPFPIYPPETSWMREPETSIPGLVVRNQAGGARVAYLPADLDRRFGRDHLPDHGNLLANIVRWAADQDIPLTVEGPGLVDCHLYKQPGRLILHLVNLTNSGAWRQPVDELISVGPLRVRVRMPEGIPSRRARLLVADRETSVSLRDGWASFEIRALLDHEVAVLGQTL